MARGLLVTVDGLGEVSDGANRIFDCLAERGIAPVALRVWVRPRPVTAASLAAVRGVIRAGFVVLIGDSHLSEVGAAIKAYIEAQLPGRIRLAWADRGIPSS